MHSQDSGTSHIWLVSCTQRSYPVSSHQKPTALAKILGVYRIGYKNSQNNTEKKLDLLVMENLFYGRKMAQVRVTSAECMWPSVLFHCSAVPFLADSKSRVTGIYLDNFACAQSWHLEPVPCYVILSSLMTVLAHSDCCSSKSNASVLSLLSLHLSWLPKTKRCPCISFLWENFVKHL